MRDYSENMSAVVGTTEGGGGDTPKSYTPPANYKPSTVDQRNNWNMFLDFLSVKGVGGSKDLDARDKSMGAQYLKEYNKAHPTNAVDESFIPTAQYESYLIRKKSTFPGLDEKQSQWALARLPEAYRNREISPVDSWLGSATSREYYPTFERGTPSGTQKFGTSFEDFLKGVSL